MVEFFYLGSDDSFDGKRLTYLSSTGQESTVTSLHISWTSCRDVSFESLNVVSPGNQEMNLKSDLIMFEVGFPN